MTASDQSSRRLLAKNSALNLLGLILPMVTALITIPYIVHGLGVDEYGLLSVAYMVLGYFGIFDLGLGRATVKFVAEHLTPELIHKVPEIVWTSVLLVLATGCVGGLILAAIVPVATKHWLTMPTALEPTARVALYILALSTPVVLANDALRGVLEASQRFDLVNCVKVPASIIFYLLAAAAIPFGLRIIGIVILLVLVRACTSILYLLLCLKAIPVLRTRPRISRSAIKPLANFGGWVMVSNIAGPIFGWLERFMIASILSVGLLTYYSVPFDLVVKLTIIPASLAPTLFPFFSYHGSGNREAISDTTSRSIKFLLLLLTPATALFLCFPAQILTLWLGPTFAAHSANVMRILALVFFFNSYAYISFTSVQAVGRPDLKAISDLLTLPVYAAAAWFLIHSNGIEGAALAKLLVTLLDCAALYFFAWKLRAFRVRDLYTGPLGRAFVASICLLGVLYLVTLAHPTLLIAATASIAIFAAFAVVFWIIAVDTDERQVLRRYSHALLMKRPSTSV